MACSTMRLFTSLNTTCCTSRKSSGSRVWPAANRDGLNPTAAAAPSASQEDDNRLLPLPLPGAEERSAAASRGAAATTSIKSRMRATRRLNSRSSAVRSMRMGGGTRANGSNVNAASLRERRTSAGPMSTAERTMRRECEASAITAAGAPPASLSSITRLFIECELIHFTSSSSSSRGQRDIATAASSRVSNAFAGSSRSPAETTGGAFVGTAAPLLTAAAALLDDSDGADKGALPAADGCCPGCC